jgi:hypothetical protein
MRLLKALSCILVAILLPIDSKTSSEMALPTASDEPVVKLLEDASSRHGFLRKKDTYAAGSTSEKLALDDGHDPYTKQRFLQETNPIVHGIYRVRVWLEVGYKKIPAELGIVLLIILLVLGSACAACCIVTPCFYVYDHYLQHRRNRISPDSNIPSDPMKSNENGGDSDKYPLDISAQV